MEKIAVIVGIWLLFSIAVTFFLGFSAILKIRGFSSLLKENDYNKWAALTKDDSLGKEKHNPFGVISCILSKSPGLADDMLIKENESARGTIHKFIIWFFVSLLSLLTEFAFALAL